MAKLPVVALKVVILVIPRGVKERAMLDEDLRRMGFLGLMERPWCFKYKKIIAELLADQDNRWAGTVGQDSNKWTMVPWHKIYGFPIWGKRMATRTEKFVDGKFKNPVSLKKGYAVPNCKDMRAKRVLEFSVPILYLKKPTRIIVMIGNTIFGALIGEREVDWALVIKDTVKRLFTIIRKSKASPICPYVFHLYITYDAIRPKDKKAYMIGELMQKHNVELDEEEPVDADDSKRESLDSAEIKELQAQQKKLSPTCRKQTPSGERKELAARSTKRQQPPHTNL